MITIGLTGGIGMGKSTVGRQFVRLGASFYCADTAVHRLVAKGGAAVKPIQKAFPGAVKSGAVDRKALAKLVFGDAKKLKKLESILHPLVRKEEEKFMKREKKIGTKLVVADIPLLFETDKPGRFDYIIVASAPPAVQRARVMARKGMTEEKFKAILARQMPDKEKQKRADFVVNTGKGRAYSLRQIKKIIKELDL